MSNMQRRDFVRVGAAGLLGLAGTPFAFAAAAIKPDAKSALLVIDVQNCFVTGGTLPVKEGEAVVPVINKLANAFENVVVTQDWHTAGHVSFASAHSGKKPFETTKLGYGTQVLWPDHCVQGSPDAALHKDLALPKAQLIIRKGYHQGTDSYSAFTEADGKTSTGLAAYLRAHGVDCSVVFKVNEGRPSLADEIVNRKISMVINTPHGRESFFDDKAVRRAAMMAGVPCITTITGAAAALEAIRALKTEGLDVRALQDYYAAVAANQ